MTGIRKTKKKIIPQMFDVRPVDGSGDLDLERIRKVRPIVELPKSGSAKGDAVPERTLRRAKPIGDVKAPEFNPYRAEAKRFRDLLEKERKERKEKLSRLARSQDYFENPDHSESWLDEPRPRHRQPEIYLRDAELSFSPKGHRAGKAVLSESEDEPEGSIRLFKIESELEKKGNRPAGQTIKAIAKAFRWPFRAAKAFLVFATGRIVSIVSTATGFLRKAIRSVASSGSLGIPEALLIPSAAFARSGARNRKRQLFAFATAFVVILLSVFGANLIARGLAIRKAAMTDGNVAYANLLEAKDGIKSRDFDAASVKFDEAYGKFSEISDDVDSLGKILVESSRFIPFLSKLSTGAHLAQAGKDISQIGSLSSELAKTLNQVKNPLDSDGSFSYLDLFNDSNQKVTEIASLVADLESNLDKVNVDDLPQDQRGRLSELKQKLPGIGSFLQSYLKESRIFVDVLGGNGPRKYLFLFQNNQEMRPTGGFIGTYAALDIFNGHIKRFIVDGIFNPDGQLREKIIPPEPIQKISANWSLHDSNWFPDFPTSAEKAAWFYEKTGGPTVDGVITMTPTVMQKLLEVTGPIEMDDYGVTVDKDNFLQTVQQEVEVDYDKDLNQPKKILADLAPKILDRIFNLKSMADITEATKVLVDSLNEKHILIYSRNYDLERIISDNGWSGEVLDTDKDYLSVINSNINGYKTDGVIDQKIEHEAEIQDDGSIVDKVTITRHHNGGDTDCEWWNKVNADYMRVYVPKGSRLLSASGQTREFDQPPVDYDALGYKRDPQLSVEEQSATVDEESGTRISEDADKTVFGNWVYVSPKETVQITYTYLLPFRIATDPISHPADSYSLLVQKQSGSVKSDFRSRIVYPDAYEAVWSYPESGMEELSDLDPGRKGISCGSDLETDDFIGLALKKKDDAASAGLLGLKDILKR